MSSNICNDLVCHNSMTSMTQYDYIMTVMQQSNCRWRSGVFNAYSAYSVTLKDLSQLSLWSVSTVPLLGSCANTVWRRVLSHASWQHWILLHTHTHTLSHVCDMCVYAETMSQHARTGYFTGCMVVTSTIQWSFTRTQWGTVFFLYYVLKLRSRTWSKMLSTAHCVLFCTILILLNRTNDGFSPWCPAFCHYLIAQFPWQRVALYGQFVLRTWPKRVLRHWDTLPRLVCVMPQTMAANSANNSKHRF